MPYCQVCLVTVVLFVLVSVNEACANYRCRTTGKKYYRSGTNYYENNNNSTYNENLMVEAQCTQHFTTLALDKMCTRL